MACALDVLEPSVGRAPAVDVNVRVDVCEGGGAAGAASLDRALRIPGGGRFCGMDEQELAEVGVGAEAAGPAPDSAPAVSEIPSIAAVVTAAVPSPSSRTSSPDALSRLYAAAGMSSWMRPPRPLAAVHDMVIYSPRCV